MIKFKLNKRDNEDCSDYYTQMCGCTCSFRERKAISKISKSICIANEVQVKYALEPYRNLPRLSPFSAYHTVHMIFFY